MLPFEGELVGHITFLQPVVHVKEEPPVPGLGLLGKQCEEVVYTAVVVCVLQTKEGWQSVQLLKLSPPTSIKSLTDLLYHWQLTLSALVRSTVTRHCL